MKKLKRSLLVILALVGMSGVGVVHAQSSSSASAASANADHSHVRTPEEIQKWQEKVKERMAKHLTDLHDKLKITSSQETAWKAFMQAMLPASVAEPAPAKDIDKMTTPERMAASLEKMKRHEAMMQSRFDAVKAFYAALTQDQQKIFDEAHSHAQKEMQEHMAKQMGK